MSSIESDLARWRQQRPILVNEAHERFSIGVLRSLGRAGYPVHACSEKPAALGFHSRFIARAVTCPDYADSTYLPWLRDYIRTHGIQCIVPTERFLLAIRQDFSEFFPLLPLSVDETVVYRGMSKFDLFERLGAGGTDPEPHLPPTLLVDVDRALPEQRALEALGQPLFVKVDGAHSKGGEESGIYRLETVSAASLCITHSLDHYKKLIVQGCVPGIGVGVFLLRWNGRTLAEFMHVRLHEVPSLGHSSYRKSWWHAGIVKDAQAKLDAMGWQGVAMMEYRWDPETDAYSLLEINGRFWGSLHLPLYAGIDFPCLLLDAFFGEVPQPVSGRNSNVRCRYTWPLEFRYVLSRIRNPGPGALWSVLEFFLLMLNPRVKSDLLFPGDRKLYWLELGNYVSFIVRRLLQGLNGRR